MPTDDVEEFLGILSPSCMLEPPVTYQGGKGRLADTIIEKVKIPPSACFYDLCCGSGAVSIAVINSGVSPERIMMVDLGPWGLVWQAIGNGSFDLDKFRHYCREVPADPRLVKTHIEKMYLDPVQAEEVPYRYLLLQAAAIGGKAISIEGSRWVRGSGFRDYWLPTETSSRRSPVNPMMPMPATILSRVEALVKGMRGVRGLMADVNSVQIEPGSVVYIDPPYMDTTGYADREVKDVRLLAERIAASRSDCWVSEGRALSPNATRLSEGRAKGGITGQRKRLANEEWLSYFPTKSLQLGF